MPWQSWINRINEHYDIWSQGWRKTPSVLEETRQLQALSVFGTTLYKKKAKKKNYINFEATKLMSHITTTLPPPNEDLFLRQLPTFSVNAQNKKIKANI